MPKAQTRLLDVTDRQGTMLSASKRMPVAPVTGVAMLDLDTLANASNPLNSAIVNVVASIDGGQTWRHVAGFQWNGGDLGKDGTVQVRPAIKFDTTGLEDARVRIEVEVPRRMRCGALVELE